MSFARLLNVMGRSLLLFFIHLFIVTECSAIGLAPGIYCGEESCYDVLGIVRDEFNKSDLSKIYRRLAKKFHPDKVKDPAEKAEAVEKFRQIATAYETLKDDGTREDYDYYLDHPEHRAYNYYQYYRRRVAPKVDVRIVIIVTITIISIFQYLSAKHKYSEALSYAIRQPKYQNGALEIARKRGLLPSEEVRGRRDRKLLKEEMEEIIRQIIEENMDIRGGYKKPSIYDTLLWYLISLPYTIYLYFIWKVKWFWKYWVKKEEYDDEAKLYLIRKNMGLSESQFACMGDEHDSFLDEELWRKEAYESWKEAKESEEKERLANSGRYKRYRRYMKSQAGSKISFIED